MKIIMLKASALLLGFMLLNTSYAQSQLEFKRLFSTPAQRAELNGSRERLIQGLDTPEQIEETVNIQEERLSKATTIQELLLPRAKFNGLIIRQSGQADYWVNGKSTFHQSELGQELKSKTHRHGKRLTLDIAEDERVHLYPGEVYSFDRERKFEGYEDPHKAKGEEVVALVPDVPTIKEEIINNPNTLEDIQAKPSEVFDETFLIKEIQKIQLLEQRLQELEGSKAPE